MDFGGSLLPEMENESSCETQTISDALRWIGGMGKREVSECSMVARNEIAIFSISFVYSASKVHILAPSPCNVYRKSVGGADGIQCQVQRTHTKSVRAFSQCKWLMLSAFIAS